MTMNEVTATAVSRARAPRIEKGDLPSAYLTDTCLDQRHDRHIKVRLDMATIIALYEALYFYATREEDPAPTTSRETASALAAMMQGWEVALWRSQLAYAGKPMPEVEEDTFLLEAMADSEALRKLLKKVGA